MKCIFVTTMDKFNILPFFCLIFFLYFFVALHLVVFFLRISQPTFYRTILNFQLYILTCKRQPHKTNFLNVSEHFVGLALKGLIDCGDFKVVGSGVT